MSTRTPMHWRDEVVTIYGDPAADNIRAFLDMLAHAEGTDRYGDQDGYNVIVGGGLFDSYADHPRVLIDLPRYGIKSSAAGRYQFIRSTWDDLVRRCKLPDFSPASQDIAAIALIKQCGAIEDIESGRIRTTIHKCRKIWASLPGAGYGQREVALENLVAVYVAAGGTDADGP